MYKLISMSNFYGELKRFDNNYENIREFLREYDFDGIELVQYEPWNDKSIPKDIIKGLHLRFYPIWIDFWRGDKEKLIKKFQNEENIKMIYGSMDKISIVNQYKKELEIAQKLDVEYVVFHVCHVDILECYTYDFKYSDEEIIDEAIDLINTIFNGSEYSFKLLFENLWWPGLTLKSRQLVQKLIDKVEYSNVGIMLDTGHLINTNTGIENIEQAVEYILNILKNLGETKRYIKGIHLNYSLSGKYVMESINKYTDNKIDYDFIRMYKEVYSHIINIDKHKPFIHNGVCDIIKELDLDFLIYEFITDSLKQLKEFVDIQDKYLIDVIY
ncbi:endonuclease 4 [Clostridium tepidiprofundi DSM 19306]|uniref:Endonuclease 4 n=1 Tax=Clostridium tepidiprofundi DSM 19306 TaxID=1121338 RepID=A0A151B5P0_9CLOT|nr:TIM barrel protein [Clostridium tepidiprofundi]KYH34967.1 endonuclease 4 [Clostridium tepidiprofundi DSM 19306]